MTGRIAEICSRIPKCEAFADVGCDHGYCARYALNKGLAERVYITDISEKCLSKAKALLKEEMAAGKCRALTGDGLDPLPEECTVLIAGMGGEEIIKILSRRMPPVFLLQPMKNTEKLRRFLIESGCAIRLDYTFEDKKFYDLILGERGKGDAYTEREFRYGRDNLKNPSVAFLKKIREEIEKLNAFLGAEALSQEERAGLLLRRAEREELFNEINGNL